MNRLAIAAWPAMFARHAPRGYSGLFLALRRAERERRRLAVRALYRAA